MNDRVPDFVFLAHVVDVVSSMHVPFAFRSCSSLPWATHPVLLPLWPVAFGFMLLQWFFSKTFTVSFYFLRGRLHQTWSVPRYGFQVTHHQSKLIESDRSYTRPAVLMTGKQIA